MKVFRLVILLVSFSSYEGKAEVDVSPVVFSAMGCGPYSPAAEEALLHYLEQEAASKSSSFMVHCGDIVTGRIKTWSESQFAHIAGILREGNRIPTFVVPGDNEWNDQWDPDQSWVFWKRHFLNFDEQWKLPETASPVARQKVRPENFAFTIDHALFIGINKVGGLVHDEKEWARRWQENLSWIAEQFEEHGENSSSAVVFAQANAEGANRSFVTAFMKLATGFGKPILYLHADGHKWIVEPEKWVPNVTRVQMDVVNEAFPPIQVTVTGNPATPFLLNRRLEDPDMKYVPGTCYWSMSGGGNGNDKIRGIASDDEDSIFVTGEVSVNCNLGGRVLDTNGSLDLVVAKLNAKGHVLWATTAGGGKIDRGYGVSASGDGGCFVTGHFESDHIQLGETVLQNTGDYDGFVARFDKKGTCLWAKRFGGTGYDFGHGIATAPDGSVVLAGTVTNAGHFDSLPLGAEGLRSAVLVKLSREGNTAWIQTAPGTATSGHNVAVGKDGMIYMSGYARGKVTWSDSVVTESAIQDISVAKYDPSGDFQWVQTTGGKADGLATSVAVDSKNGNVCIVGMFKGTAVFGDKTFSSRGGHDFYAAVLSPEGRFLQAHHGGGTETDYGLGACALPGGGFAFTGELSQSGEFGGKTHQCAGERDAFIATIPGDGGQVRSFRLSGGKDHDLSYAITASRDGALVISGAFRNETQLGALKLKAIKGNDIFIGKFRR